MAGIQPIEREVAGIAGVARADAGTAYQAMLVNDWQWRGPGGIYSLFQEMEDKDAHLFATLQTRKNSLLGCEWRVAAGDVSGAARDAASLVQDVLASIPGFHDALFQLLDAFAKGFAIAEIIWQVDSRANRVGIGAIRSRHQGDFALDSSGGLHLLADTVAGAGVPAQNRAPANFDCRFLNSALLPRPGEQGVPFTPARRMPERKFIRFHFRPCPLAPYGTPLCAKAYWYYWFKKNNLKFWSLYNEKFGAPTALARYGPATTPEDLARLAEVLESLQNDTGILIPESIALEFLEARRAGAAGSYREFADWCNDEMSKIVLGQTLTTGEGRRSGSLALGRVHDLVRHEYLAADARAFADALTAQVVRWIVDFNLGTATPAPRLAFDVDEPADLREELEIDRGLIQLGVALAPEYFYSKYRRPAPDPNCRALKYDDANLYQYHLQYGVLTINEVRGALGLAPVPWGDVAPMPAAAVPAPEFDADAVEEPREARRDVGGR